MEFLPDPQDPLGLPAMELEEPKDPKVPPEDHPSSTQWASGPGGPVTLSEMDLDASGVQVLAQQLEALPGDLGGPFPEGEPCPLHIATGRGLATQDSTDTGGLLSADAGGDDLLGLLRCETSLPAQPGPPDPPQTTPRLLQPPEEPEGDPGSPGWMEGVSAEPADSRSSSSSPEPWLETAPLVTQQEPPVGAQVTPRPMNPDLGGLQRSPGTQACPSSIFQSPETLASCPAVSEGKCPFSHRTRMF